MSATQEQIIRGILRYAREQVLPASDGPFRVMLSMVLGVAEAKPEKLNSIFEHPLIHNEDGQYDIQLLENIMVRTVEELGGINITIPPIMFVMPQGTVLTLKSDDIRRIASYINEVSL